MLLRKKTNYRNYTVAAACIAALLMLWGMISSPAFAADDDDGGKVNIAVTAGEHGVVNGKTGSFTEKVDLGSDVTLTMKADEGYVINAVSVNEEELESEDLEGIAGKQEGTLTLEAVEEDTTVSVTFNEDKNAGGESEPGSGDGTGDTDGSEPGNGTTDDEGGTPAGETDPSETADPDGTAAGDEQGSDDKTDPAPQVAGDTDGEGTAADGSDEHSGEDAAGDENTADDEGATDGKENADKDNAGNDAADTDTSDSDKVGKEGNASATPDKGSTGSAYVSDNSPKTGDELPMKAIALLLASLCVSGVLAGRKLLRRFSGMFN